MAQQSSATQKRSAATQNSAAQRAPIDRRPRQDARGPHRHVRDDEEAEDVVRLVRVLRVFSRCEQLGHRETQRLPARAARICGVRRVRGDRGVRRAHAAEAGVVPGYAHPGKVSTSHFVTVGRDYRGSFGTASIDRFSSLGPEA